MILKPILIVMRLHVLSLSEKGIFIKKEEKTLQIFRFTLYLCVTKRYIR